MTRDEIALKILVSLIGTNAIVANYNAAIAKKTVWEYTERAYAAADIFMAYMKQEQARRKALGLP